VGEGFFLEMYAVRHPRKISKIQEGGQQSKTKPRGRDKTPKRGQGGTGGKKKEKKKKKKKKKRKRLNVSFIGAGCSRERS